MSQSLDNMLKTIALLNDNFLSHKKCTVQKIQSSPHYLCLHCRFPGHTLFFYLGRGGTHQGCAIGERSIPIHLRVKDRYLEYARKYWRSMTITKMVVSDDDRVLCIEGHSKHGHNKIYFFWRGRDLFFAHVYLKENKGRLYKSWEKTLEIDSGTFEELNDKMLFQGLGFGKNVKNKGDINIEHYLDNQKAYKKEFALSNRLIKKNRKLEINLLRELDNIKKGLELIHYTEKDLSTVSKIGEGRYKVNFFNIEGHYKKRSYLFEKIKQWKLSKKVIEQRLSLIKKVKVEDMNPEQNFRIPVKIISPIWVTQKPASNINRSSKFIYFNYKDFTCFLGRNSVENDYLRTKVAKKSDIWVHLENMKSGHLFIRNGLPTVEDFSLLASALVELCGIELTEIPIIYTEVSNLKGLKGSRGSVTYKKEKRLTLFFCQEWRQDILDLDEVLTN